MLTQDTLAFPLPPNGTRITQMPPRRFPMPHLVKYADGASTSGRGPVQLPRVPDKYRATGCRGALKVRVTSRKVKVCFSPLRMVKFRFEIASELSPDFGHNYFLLASVQGASSPFNSCLALPY